MIRIIKEGHLSTFETVCGRCECEFEFDERDYETNFNESTGYEIIRYVKCPYCGSLVYDERWKRITTDAQ